MAHYKRFNDQNHVYVEQNIVDDNELESYEAKFNFDGVEKTSVLYYYEDRDKERFYLLGIKENLELSNVFIVSDDLSPIFQYKTAKTRRKHLYRLIQEQEEKLNN